MSCYPKQVAASGIRRRRCPGRSVVVAGQPGSSHRASGSAGVPAGLTVKAPRISHGREPILTVTWNEIDEPEASCFGAAALARESLGSTGDGGTVGADDGILAGSITAIFSCSSSVP